MELSAGPCYVINVPLKLFKFTLQFLLNVHHNGSDQAPGSPIGFPKMIRNLVGSGHSKTAMLPIRHFKGRCSTSPMTVMGSDNS